MQPLYEMNYNKYLVPIQPIVRAPINFLDLVQMVKKKDCIAQYEMLSFFDDILGKRLGSGCFGVVYECPWDSTRVIKVRAAGTEDELLEDGWIQWAAFCMTAGREFSPHVLDVFSVWVGKHTYIAEIEKLHGSVWETANLPPYTTYRAVSFARTVGHCAIFSDHVIKRKNMYSGVHNSRKMKSLQDKYKQEVKRLEKASGLHFNDAHTNNLMYRKTRTGWQVVITDPVSENYNNDPRKIVYRCINKGVTHSGWRKTEHGLVSPEDYARIKQAA